MGLKRGFALDRRKGGIAKDDIALIGGDDQHFFERSVIVQRKGKAQRTGRPATAGKGGALDRGAVTAIPKASRTR